MSEERSFAEKKPDDNYYRLLKEIQAVDFVLVELNLYLDTHPYDYQAIQQYNDYVRKSMELKHSFQTLYGPLMHFGHSYAGTPWNWDDTPWPWQV
jgi:spore coat protein JB